MQRRVFVKMMGGLVAGTFTGFPNAFSAPRAGRRPNILVCMADDWGWPFAPQYGDATIETPAFDRIAGEGVLFMQAFCSAPTCTVCTSPWPCAGRNGSKVAEGWTTS